MSTKIEMLTAVALTALIKSVTTRSQKLGPDLHKCLVQCMAHAEAHGDTRPAERLVSGIHASQRVESIAAWFAEFSPIAIVRGKKKGTTKARLRATSDTKYKAFDLAAANAKPFWERSETNPHAVSLSDLMRMANVLRSKADKFAEEAGATPEFVAAARAISRKVPAFTKEQIALQKEADAELVDALPEPKAAE